MRPTVLKYVSTLGRFVLYSLYMLRVRDACTSHVYVLVLLGVQVPARTCTAVLCTYYQATGSIVPMYYACHTMYYHESIIGLQYLYHRYSYLVHNHFVNHARECIVHILRCVCLDAGLKNSFHVPSNKDAFVI
jgi:hypothetical protein